MPSATPHVQTARRLNPNALPPATAGRFLLLIATAVASSIYVYAWMVSRLESVSDAPASCVRTARAEGVDLLPQPLIDWYSDCVVWTNVQQARVVALMLFVFTVVTVVIYWCMPIWLARGLKPLRDLDADMNMAPVVREIERILAEHPLRPAASLYVDHASGRGANRAFGRFGRYAIALDIGLLARAVRDGTDPRLRCVLRHEMAHIRNRDIDLTYLTIAVWWGFLAAVALPFTVVAVNAPDALMDFAWRILLLLVLLWFVRAAVIRSREYHADASAVETVADEQALAESLRPNGSGGRGVSRPGLGYLVYHPTSGERVDTVRSSDRLFRLSPGVAGATGALVGLAYPPAHYWTSLLYENGVYEPGWICGLLIGLLTATVLGGAAWRAAVWAAAAPGRRVQVLPSSAGFAGALALALLLSPRLPGAPQSFTVVQAAPSVGIAAGLVLLAIVHAYLRWMLLCAACWLPVAGSPRRAYLIGLAQSAVVIGVWLAAWFQAVDMLAATGATWTGLALVLAVTLLNPLVLLSVPWACVFPIATWQTRRMAGRARRHSWWRVVDGEPPGVGLPGLRTPLGASYLTAAAIVAGYALAVRPLYDDLARALERTNSLIDAPVREHLTIVGILLLPALLVTFAGLFLHGLAVGGRARTGRAVASAGTCLLPASIGVFVVLLMHLTLASPITRDLLTLLSGLSGISVGSPLPDDRPVNASLGLMVLALLTVLFVVGMVAAALGSAVRMVRPVRRARRTPGRPAWQAALLIVPLLTGGAVLGGLSWIEWRVPQTVEVEEAVDHRAVEEILNAPWPRSVPLPDACLSMIMELAGENLTTEVSGLHIDTVLARAAAHARSADDRTMRKMGEGVIESLRRDEVRRAAKGIAAAGHYCVAVIQMR
jgi:Zn-dependent protease with chaperone function